MPHVMRRHIVYCMFFVGHTGNKTDKVWQQISRRGVIGTVQNFAGSYMGGLVYTVWLGSRQWTFSTNLVNFDSGVLRCHAATCISPSLMHLKNLNQNWFQLKSMSYYQFILTR